MGLSRSGTSSHSPQCAVTAIYLYTLSALTTGLRDRGPVRAPWSRGQGIWTCATTRIRRSGQSAKGWQLCWVSLHDATGNRLDPIGLDSTSANGAVNGTFLGSLWPDEVAWKVRVQYAPTAQFSPSDLWSVQGIPLAASGVTINSGATATRHGITLRLIGTTGPHTPRTDGGFSYVPQGDSPSVQVEAVSPPDALQGGRACSWSWSGPLMSEAGQSLAAHPR